MEKYATYNVFQNIETKEIKRVPFTDQEEMVKIANLATWQLLQEDPEDIDESTIRRNEESS